MACLQEGQRSPLHAMIPCRCRIQPFVSMMTGPSKTMLWLFANTDCLAHIKPVFQKDTQAAIDTTGRPGKRPVSPHPMVFSAFVVEGQGMSRAGLSPRSTHFSGSVYLQEPNISVAVQVPQFSENSVAALRSLSVRKNLESNMCARGER